MDFWLGIQHPNWLATAGVPLFVSARRLRGRKRLPRAAAPWVLDSGGFSELSLFGRWETKAEDYAAEASHFQEEIGQMTWAVVQDWMCEPIIRNGGWVGKGKNRRQVPGTGLTVAEHQRRTIESYQLLTVLAPEVPWVPVLQGWEYADYLDHAGQYAAAGIDLPFLPLVGLGSVCRRQDTTMAEEVIRELAGQGIRLHGFGFKTLGLPRVARHLASADSLAWSFSARYGQIRLPGCTHPVCTQCLRFAMLWRERLLGKVARATAGPRQGLLFEGAS